MLAQRLVGHVGKCFIRRKKTGERYSTTWDNQGDIHQGIFAFACRKNEAQIWVILQVEANFSKSIRDIGLYDVYGDEDGVCEYKLLEQASQIVFI